MEYYKYLHIFPKNFFNLRYIKSSTIFLLDLSGTFGQES